MIKINRGDVEQIVVDEYVSGALAVLRNVNDGYMEGKIWKNKGKLIFTRRYGNKYDCKNANEIIKAWIEFVGIEEKDYLYVNRYGNGISFEIINDVFDVMGED